MSEAEAKPMTLGLMGAMEQIGTSSTLRARLWLRVGRPLVVVDTVFKPIRVLITMEIRE